jgi:hypothetical protein
MRLAITLNPTSAADLAARSSLPMALLFGSWPLPLHRLHIFAMTKR